MDSANLPWWQDLTTREVAELAARDPVLVLPLSAIEQHGPHLPLDTDDRIGLGLLERACAHLSDEFPLRILPPMRVATSDEHSDYPGTLTLQPETALAVLRDLGSSIARTGIRRLLLHNSHGGNAAIMELAALDLRRRHALLVGKYHYFRQPLPSDVEIPPTEVRHGLHGGQIETAMLLHLAPHCVRTGAIDHARSLGEDLQRELEILGPEGQASFAWLAQDLNPQGVVGDGRSATAEQGRRLVEHYAAGLAAAIRDTRRFPLERLGR